MSDEVDIPPDVDLISTWEAILDGSERPVTTTYWRNDSGSMELETFSSAVSSNHSEVLDERNEFSASSDHWADDGRTGWVEEQSEEWSDSPCERMADELADRMAGDQCGRWADEACDRWANEVCDRWADEYCDRMADEDCDRWADECCDRWADEMADKMANEMANEITDRIANKSVDAEGGGRVNENCDRSADEACDQICDKMAGMLADMPAEHCTVRTKSTQSDARESQLHPKAAMMDASLEISGTTAPDDDTSIEERNAGEPGTPYAMLNGEDNIHQESTPDISNSRIPRDDPQELVHHSYPDRLQSILEPASELDDQGLPAPHSCW
jgi:pyruvoyl-dependent arginine decarboxylase (PvlArgDC)